MKAPDRYQLVYPREEIAEQTRRVAEEVNEWLEMVDNKAAEQVLAVCVLRGAVFFFADLLRAIDYSLEPVFCRAQSYVGVNERSGKGVRVSVEDVPAHNRHILLIDDICDTGLTLLKLHNVFLDLGAKSVRSAVLIHREVEHSRYEPSWSAFNYSGPEWFAGCGLNGDDDRLRNLPDVYILKPE